MRTHSIAWIAAAALALGGAAAPARAQSDIKIGFINSYSGFLAQAGQEMDEGVALYVKTHEKELPAGVNIQVIKRDDTSTPEVAKRLAQELITRDHVQILFGVVASPNAAAIAPLTAEAKVPLLITNAAGSAITRISPFVVRVSFTQWQEALPLGQWAVKQGWKTAFSAVSDFIPGHDADNAFQKGFTDAGGKMVGAIAFSPTSPDFPPVVQRIRDTKPDVAFVWVPAGEQATGMMKAIRDLGVRQAGINIVSTQDLLPDEELPNMGDTPVGLYTTGNYSTAATRPANKEFLAAWDKEYGTKAIPDFLSVDGWDGMHAVFDLIKSTKGKFTGEEAAAFFTHWKTDDSPRGPISVDPNTRDIVQNIYVRHAEMKNGKLVNTEIDTLPNVKDPWKELKSTEAMSEAIRFDDRVAIVTGAGNGLGRCHALGLAARGAKVVVNDPGGALDGSGKSAAAEKVAAEIAAEGGSAIADTADVTDPAQVAAMVERAMSRWGRIDILVNNAGILRDKSFAKMALEDFRAVIEVHLMGAVHCAKAVWETMRAQNYGRVVFTTSSSGLYGNFGQANYGAAKASMIGLMKVLDQEGRKNDIRVNLLSPTAATRMTENLLPPEDRARLDPASVTPGLLYLVSDAAPSGVMLCAGAGCFARAEVVETRGLYLSLEERTPEAIAARFAEVSARDGEATLADAWAQTKKYVAMAHGSAKS